MNDAQVSMLNYTNFGAGNHMYYGSVEEGFWNAFPLFWHAL